MRAKPARTRSSGSFPRRSRISSRPGSEPFAALDDYRTAALGYAAGSAAGLAYIVARTGSDGIVAVVTGMAVSAAVGLAIPLIVLGWRAHRTSMPASAAVPQASRCGIVWRCFGAAAAIPLSLQLAYVVSIPFAGRLGEGAVTSFGYAYLAATTIVASPPSRSDSSRRYRCLASG